MWTKRGSRYVRTIGKIKLVARPIEGRWVAYVEISEIVVRTTDLYDSQYLDLGGKPRSMSREAKHDAERMLREWIEGAEVALQEVKDEVG